jgi:hypothetical protein
VTYHVQTTVELRKAVTQAQAGDTIVLHNGPYQLDGQLTLRTGVVVRPE